MASNIDFLEFVCSQLEGIGTICNGKEDKKEDNRQY